jgi:peptidoglycan hydrolase-like protein with peptidoglycan-binding domain
LFCDIKQPYKCEPGIAGTDCSFDSEVCQAGLICDNSSKKCIQNNGSSGQNPTKYPVPQKDDAPTNPPGSCGTDVSSIVIQIQNIVGAAPDGICGPKTVADIQIWQNAHGLTDDGIVGSKTASAMGVSLTGSSNSTPSGSTATQGSCPSADLISVNGLCLPKNTAGCSGGICASTSLTDLLIKIITLLLSVAGIIAVLMLIVGGFWYITSAGNEEQAEKGKTAITNAIIGVIVVLLSYAVVTVIGALVNTGK